MPEYLAIEVAVACQAAHLAQLSDRRRRHVLRPASGDPGCMRLTDSHLFAFRDASGRKEIAGVPDPEYGHRVPKAEKVKLEQYFTG